MYLLRMWVCIDRAKACLEHKSLCSICIYASRCSAKRSVTNLQRKAFFKMCVTSYEWMLSCRNGEISSWLLDSDDVLLVISICSCRVSTHICFLCRPSRSSCCPAAPAPPRWCPADKSRKISGDIHICWSIIVYGHTCYIHTFSCSKCKRHEIFFPTNPLFSVSLMSLLNLE